MAEEGEEIVRHRVYPPDRSFSAVYQVSVLWREVVQDKEVCRRESRWGLAVGPPVLLVEARTPHLV